MTKRFAPLFLEFLTVLAIDIPKVFFTASPIYRAMRKSGIKKRTVQIGLGNIRHRGMIKPYKDGYILTEKGKSWLNQNRYRYFRSIYKIWDKKWRVVIFDIPYTMDKQRHVLRHRLKFMGAYMLQKSIFVFPYPCEEELGYWCSGLGLSDYVDVIITEHLGSKDSYVKKYFNL